MSKTLSLSARFNGNRIVLSAGACEAFFLALSVAKDRDVNREIATGIRNEQPCRELTPDGTLKRYVDRAVLEQSGFKNSSGLAVAW